MAGLSALGGTLFWFCFRKLDKEEFELNALKEGVVAATPFKGEHAT